MKEKPEAITHIAVVTPYQKNFDLWVADNRKPYTEYYHVRERGDLDGRHIDKVEYLRGFEMMKDAGELKDYCDLILFWCKKRGERK